MVTQTLSLLKNWLAPKVLFPNGSTACNRYASVLPMTTFRGEPLTHDVAEGIMQGWYGDEVGLYKLFSSRPTA